MNEVNSAPCFEFMSEEKLRDFLETLKHNRSSCVQVMSIVKRLLQSDFNMVVILKAIPEILTCSSSEFEVLCPYFEELMVRDPLIASHLLGILKSFDCEGQARVQAFRLSMKIFECVEADHMPELLSYSLFVIAPAFVTDFYTKMKEIFTVHNDVRMYKALEDGLKPHLPRFFSCLAKVTKWQFYDFFVLLSSLTRPSLRAKVASIVWPALFNGSLRLNKLAEYVSKSRILGSKLHSVIRFVDILMSSVPKSMTYTTLYPMITLCGNIVHCYQDAASAFIDQLIAYVTSGPNFAASVAICVMLRMDKAPLASHAIHLDEIISQSSSLHPASLYAICEILAVSTPIEHRPMLLVSIPKRLFHHSQVLIEAGIAISLQLVADGAEESIDILSSVLKAISVNWLVVKSSVLLSVIELMWLVKDDTIRTDMLLFCMKVIRYFGLVAVVDQRTVTVGSERDKYAISLSKILDEEQSEFCSELIVITSNLLQTVKPEQAVETKYKKEVAYLVDLTRLSYIVPKEFVDLIAEPKTDAKIAASQAQVLLILRAFLFPLISRLQGSFEDILFLIQLVATIDDFLTNIQIAGRASLPDLDSLSVFHPQFIFGLLKEECFHFPDDVILLSLMFRSLRLIFLDVSHSRHFFNEPLDFLDTKMDDLIPLRIVTLIDSILKLASHCKKRNEMKMMKKCIRAACDAIDFVMFCATFKHTDISFEKDVAPCIKYADDVGVACRLLVLGIHLNTAMNLVSDIAIASLRQYYVCNLCDYPVLYPYGLRDMESIVKPYQPGANWRLVVYLSLMFCAFEQFTETFTFLIQQIQEERIEVQIALVLIDIVTTRLPEFTGSFDACVRFAIDLVQLVMDSDITVLVPLSKLINTLNKLKREVPHSPGDLNDLADLMNSAFRRFGNLRSRPRLQMVFATLKGECDLLCEDQPQSPEEEQHEPVTNPFDVQHSSGDEFEFAPDSDTEEEEDDEYVRAAFPVE